MLEISGNWNGKEEKKTPSFHGQWFQIWHQNHLLGSSGDRYFEVSNKDFLNIVKLKSEFIFMSQT